MRKQVNFAATLADQDFPMHNPTLDRLVDYPFDRLRALLDGVTPPPGIAPINMSLGEPQHPPPDIIAREVAANATQWGRYPPTAGSEDLLAAITQWLGRRYGLPAGMIDPAAHLCAVSGTREALYTTGDLVVPRTLDGKPPAVLIPNPFYQVYVGATLMSGAEPVFVPATKATGFLPDYAAVADEVLERTVLAFVCSPANPQGMAADLDYLKNVVGLARRHDFVLAMDECYAEIYDAEPPAGIFQACAALGGSLDNVIAFHSLSKRSSAPGLRSGFVAGDAALIRLLKRLRSYGGATLPGPIIAASAALWRDEAHVESNRALYRRKFDAADAVLGGTLGHYRPDGGFYLWLDVGDGEAAAKRLWAEAAIRVIPGVYLAREGDDGVNPGAGYIRVALVHGAEETEIALDRIAETLT